MDTTVGFDAGILIVANFNGRESITVAKVKSLLRWVAPSEPVVEYVVEAVLGPVFDADDPDKLSATTPDTEYDLRALISLAAGEVYSFAVSAKNAAGNIGDPGLLEGQIVDFTVPGAPTGLEIVFGS